MIKQDWLYEDGDDTTKSVYVAKMDEIRFIAGPIIQRHKDKVEAEREAIQKAQEEEAAKKRAEVEAQRKAEEDAKKEQEAQEPKNDAEMKDAPPAEGETEEQKQ